ncbi:MAG: type II secretion system F family protein, partial [Actinomycetota bacterium]
MAMAPAAFGKGAAAVIDWFFIALTAAAAAVVVLLMTGDARPPVLERLLPQGAQKAARRPLLHAFSERVASLRIGVLLKEYAEKTHPQLIFSDVVALCLLGLLAGGLAGALFLPAGPMTLLAAAAGPLTVDRVLLKMHGRRSARISQQLPEALQIQTSALRAGNSLVQSLRGVAQRARPPLA